MNNSNNDDNEYNKNKTNNNKIQIILNENPCFRHI